MPRSRKRKPLSRPLEAISPDRSDWAARWILDPRKIDPKTKMTVPGITPEQVEAVRMFVWKASIEASKAPPKPQ